MVNLMHTMFSDDGKDNPLQYFLHKIETQD